MPRIYFILVFAFCSFGKANGQTFFDFDPDMIGVQKTEWYRYYHSGPGSQKENLHNGLDSMYVFFNYPKKTPKNAPNPKHRYSSGVEFSITYKGQFNNNQLEGEGTMEMVVRSSGSNGYPTWVYKGQFKQGLAEGYGELRTLFMKKPCYFRGLFRQGKPVDGMVVSFFHRQRKEEPTFFYCGEVRFGNESIYPEGWGAVLRTQLDHDDIEQTDNVGLGGGFYAGQFFRGSMTGFGICNHTDYGYGLDMQPLVPVLVGADDIFCRYDPIPIRAEFLAGKPFMPQSFTNSRYEKLIPDVKKSVYAELDMGNGVFYKGMVWQNLPHGLGYVEYPGNFRDMSLWNLGQKILWKEAVDNLLPEKGMIEPKRILAATYRCSTVVTRLSGGFDYPELKCSKGIYPMLYYGRLNGKGFPEGWGWKVTGEENNYVYGQAFPLIGKFNGTDPAEDTSGLASADSLYQYSYNQQPLAWKNYYDAFKAAEDQYYGNTEYGVFDPLKPAEPVRKFVRDIKRTAISDSRIRRMIHTEFSFKEKERIKALSERTIGISALNYNRSNPAQSYITTTNGKTVNGIYIPKEEIKALDYVFFNNRIYYIHQSYKSIYKGKGPNDGYLDPDKMPSKLLVFRGPVIPIKYRKTICSYCNNQSTNSGPVTYTAQVNSGRSETKVYQNNSGTYSVVTTPVYNSFNITVPAFKSKPCAYCGNKEGWEIEEIKMVEW